MNDSHLPDLSVALLHEQMLNKQGQLITTSLTLIDVHDIARSARTYRLSSVFIAHPAPTLRRLANVLKAHWQDGFGASYNPNRKDALTLVQIVADLNEAIDMIRTRSRQKPHLIATSARKGGERISFTDMRNKLWNERQPFLLLLGTGWGMSEELLRRADYFLEPLKGPSDYNHLSVRSACAIMLDRLMQRP